MKTNPPKTQVLKNLKAIPGVGNKIAEDLWTLGIRKAADLQEKDPELLYDRLCHEVGYQLDRCLLYVLRCAVYYASHDEHDPILLKW
jgi:nucleotidyltransferase/DNA polymerase involved in DNA repair